MSKRIPIFLGFILIFIAIWLLTTPAEPVRLFIERFDHIGYDIQLRTRLLKHVTPKTPIAIVDIDDESLDAEGHWPWPRTKLAKLVDALQRDGVAVIAFDMFFSEKEPNIAQTLFNKLSKENRLNTSLASLLKESEPLFDTDTIFAKSIAQSQIILAVGFLPRKQEQNSLPKPLLTLTSQEARQLDLFTAAGYISNVPILEQAAKSAGFLNIFPDSDGILRRAALLISYKNDVYPLLALEAVRWYLGTNIKLVTPFYGETKKLEGVQIGNQVIPTDEQGQVLIPFIGKSFTFPYYSATDVLHDKIPKDALLGKIIFIGASATGLGDLKATAAQNPFPGVEVQATIANGILNNDFSYIPAWTFGANIFFTIVFGLFATLVFPYLGPRTLGIFLFIMPPTLVFINSLIWEMTGLILSFLLPIVLTFFIAILNMVYGYLFETRRRERLKEMFGQYVPGKHIDEMLKTSGDYGLLGEDRDMSVLFADIRNFTTISEGMTAAQVKELLNTFFTPMTEVIFKHRGTIDKYVGDLIMAFWGAPLKDKNHARHAIESALEMQTKMRLLQTEFAKRKWPEIRIGIGVNSGTMSIGDMGSRFRRNYTVLGDAVNLASRIESLTKYYGVNIIVTENTQRDQQRFVFRKLDRVRVKGKKISIDIYETICFAAELTTKIKEEIESSTTALQYYFEQRFDQAYYLFDDLHHKYPEKKLYSLYLDRINVFKERPPLADWDGVYVHVGK